MKKFTFTLTLLALLLTAALFTGPAAFAQSIDETSSATVDCPICDIDLSDYSGPLTAGEIQGLLLALNDEYHAYAVYGQVIDDFGTVRPFTNIQRAESNHARALINLFNRYDVPVPANPWLDDIASFPSVTAACQAGVDAEILNRDLYTVLFASTDRTDIERVYSALQQASDEQHLPAFERCAAR